MSGFCEFSEPAWAMSGFCEFSEPAWVMSGFCEFSEPAWVTSGVCKLLGVCIFPGGCIPPGGAWRFSESNVESESELVLEAVSASEALPAPLLSLTPGPPFSSWPPPAFMVPMTVRSRSEASMRALLSDCCASLVEGMVPFICPRMDSPRRETTWHRVSAAVLYSS